MKLRIATLLTALLTLAALVRAQTTAQQDLEKLRGNWTIVNDERDGKVHAAGKGAQTTVKDNLFTTKSGDKILREGTMMLDPTKKPKAIDTTFKDGEFKGQTLHGIYTIEGDTWTLCYGLPGQERPKEMPAKAGKGQLLLVLKRAKS